MKMFILPIEPLQERYTDWWEQQIPNGFRWLGNEVVVIEGKTFTGNVIKGTVLDTYGTNYIKAQQIERVCELFQHGEVKDGDVFFVCDIWFPGIEAIRYMANLSGIKVKIFGIWHAGSITIEDFMAPEHQWAKYFEIGYLNMCDGVFVGSEYSRQAILERLLPYVLSDEEAKYIADKIYAYGLPMNFVQMNDIKTEKKPRVLFPSRFDIEKRPNVFLDMIEVIVANKLYPKGKGVEFVFCTGRDSIRTNESWLLKKYKFMNQMLANDPDVSIDFKFNLDKKAYYTLMSESTCMVSCTVDETFGYCVAEACALGTVPIVPRKFCYEEVLSSSDAELGSDLALGAPEYMYSTFDELVSAVTSYLKLWEDDNIAKQELAKHKPILRSFVDPYSGVIREWDRIIKLT